MEHTSSFHRSMVRSLGKRSAIHVKERTMARVVGEQTAVRPFRIDVPEEDLLIPYREDGGGLR